MTWWVGDFRLSIARSESDPCTQGEARTALHSHHPDQILRGIKRKTRKAADQRAVEADVLQVAADIDLDQADQLRHVPGLDLIGDEAGDAALLVGDEAAQHHHDALIDFRAHLGISRELAAGFHEHGGEMLLQDSAAAGAVADHRDDAGPQMLRQVAELRPRQHVAFQLLDAVRIGGFAVELVHERADHAVELVAERLSLIHI